MNTPNLPEGIVVLVDGGCLNNNKPVSERVMYGSLCVFHNGQRVLSTYRGVKVAVHQPTLQDSEASSNNMAEVMMLDKALDYIDELIERRAELPQITIASDSEWALGMMTGEMKPKKANDLLRYYIDKVKGRFLHSRVNTMHVDNAWVKEVLGH